MTKEEAIELAKVFFEELRGDIHIATKEHKLGVINSIMELKIDKEEYLNMMLELKRLNPEKASKVWKAKDVVTAFKAEEEKFNTGNLIKPGEKYYHPKLMDVPPAPVLKELDNGEWIRLNDDKFELKYKERFTLEDALDYYLAETMTKSMVRKKDIGALRKILEYCDGSIDLLLFTIDATRNQLLYEGRLGKHNSVFELTNNIADAVEYLETKKTILRTE